MKIVVVGGTGTIGQAVVSALKSTHEVLLATRSGGDITLDMTDKASIESMFKSLEEFDALVVASGKVHFGALDEMNDETYRIGLDNKLMGSVNLALAAIPYLNYGGSITLTTGILNRSPIVQGSSAAMVNGALEGFVQASAIEMPRGIRINAVSPTVITEAMPAYGDYFKGYIPVDAATAAQAYVKSIEGAHTGQVYCVEG